MEKQSLIKYYCASFLVLVLLTGSNITMAQISPTTSSSSSTSKPAVTISPEPTQSSEKPRVESDNSMWIPLTVSILALIASGGAIALSILKSKELDSTKSLIEKYDNKLKLLENKSTELLTTQTNLLSSQQRESVGISSATPQDSIYLEATIERLSERISELENKSKVAQNSLQSVNHSKDRSYSQNYSLEPVFNPFNQPVNLSKSDNIQSVESFAYIELVNTYNSNPKLLEQKAVRVSEPTDSIARRHADSSQKIVLEKASNSNYWVIHNDGCMDCWLLPKSKLRIDQFRYETTKALFECNGYHPEYSTFKLVKPAKVISISADEQTWQLEEPGILEFTV